MIFSVFAYSRRGCETARRVMDLLAGGQCRGYTMEKFQQTGFSPIEKPSGSFYGEKFSMSDALIFVGSCGIAVREIEEDRPGGAVHRRAGNLCDSHSLRAHWRG